MKSIQIYSLLKKGALHPVYCEDFQIAIQIDDEYDVFAVMDGCSSGTDSHFASALMGKLISKAAKLVHHPQVWAQVGMADIPRPEGAKGLARYFLYFIFEELRRIRNEMIMDMEELLSTLLLLVYDRQKDQAYITVKGDGVVAIDGKIHEIEEYNAPRYPALYLGKPFQEWMEIQKVEFLIPSPRDLSIATDGAASYLKRDLQEDETVNSLACLLTDFDYDSKDFLERQHKALLAKGLRPVDDLSIIRLRFGEGKKSSKTPPR